MIMQLITITMIITITVLLKIHLCIYGNELSNAKVSILLSYRILSLLGSLQYLGWTGLDHGLMIVQSNLDSDYCFISDFSYLANQTLTAGCAHLKYCYGQHLKESVHRT